MRHPVQLGSNPSSKLWATLPKVPNEKKIIAFCPSPQKKATQTNKDAHAPFAWHVLSSALRAWMHPFEFEFVFVEGETDEPNLSPPLESVPSCLPLSPSPMFAVRWRVSKGAPSKHPEEGRDSRELLWNVDMLSFPPPPFSKLSFLSPNGSFKSEEILF